jgi:uncharacterized protein (DUF2236 family)
VANDEMRRLAREAALLAGGGRAILLQVAHPAVARGVAEHSDFASRPLDRLRATLTYVYAVTFGTPEEAAAVSAMVTDVHRKVTGAGYRATDPELQLWVAATLYDTAALIHGELFGPLAPEVAEPTYRQYAVLATALQVPERLWPEDRAAFAAYWRQMVETLEVGEHARRIAGDLLHPKQAPLLIKAGMPLERFLTTAWLPERVREAYGLPWDDRRQRRYELLVKTGGPLYRALPGRLREAPKDYYLRDLRKRLAARPGS